MKSEALETEFGEAKLGHRTSAPHDFVDVDITHVGQFASLHMQVAIGQAGRRFHLGERDRFARHKRGEDA